MPPSSKPALAFPSTKPPAYNCPICHDTYWVYPWREDGKPDYTRVIVCPCSVERVRRDLEQRLLKYCSLPDAAKGKTLASFETRGYERLSTALALAKQIAAASDDVKWLTLMGGRDRGKSHLGYGVCLAWLSRGKPARYGLVSLLLKELRDGFTQNDEYSYRETFNRLCSIGLLVLDDLGVENPTDWALEQIQTILDYRYANALHTVITTNRPLTDLFYAQSDPQRASKLKEASSRIASRAQRESWARVVVLDSLEHRLWV